MKRLDENREGDPVNIRPSYLVLLFILLAGLMLVPAGSCEEATRPVSVQPPVSSATTQPVVVQFFEVPLVLPPQNAQTTAATLQSGSALLAGADSGMETANTGEGIQWVRQILFEHADEPGYGSLPYDDGELVYTILPADDSFVQRYQSKIALWLGLRNESTGIQWVKRYAVYIGTTQLVLPPPDQSAPVRATPVPTAEPTPVPEPIITPVPTAVPIAEGSVNRTGPICFGGSLGDAGFGLADIQGLGYIVVGATASNDGDVSGNHGSLDVWVLMLGTEGESSWQKTLGGSKADAGSAVAVLPDGTYAVVGTTLSNDGDVNGNHGKSDVWVTGLDEKGALIWQECYGGTQDDGGADLIATPDGGLVVAGWTHSFTEPNRVENQNGWILRIGPDHELVWNTVIGDSGSDALFAVTAAPEGGYVLTGSYTDIVGAASTIISGKTGYTSAWVVQVSEDGSCLGQNVFGGTLNDAGYAIAPVASGGYLVTGFTDSADGDINRAYGGRDLFLLRLDGQCKLIWSTNLGGSGNEEGWSVTETQDGGIIVAGYTTSTDGMVSGNHGKEDAWVVKVTAEGTPVWQRCIGGSGADYAEKIVVNEDGSIVVTGKTASDNGDITGNHGLSDLWIVTLGSDGSMLPAEPVAGQPGDGSVLDPMIYLLILLVLLLLGGFVISEKRRRDEGAAEARKRAYAAFEELKSEIARLQKNGVIIPEKITDLTPLQALLNAGDWSKAENEAKDRLAFLHDLERVYLASHDALALLKGEIARLEGKGVSIEDNSVRAESLIDEGKYLEAKSFAEAEIARLRSIEVLFDRANAGLSLLRSEITRLQIKGVLIPDQAEALETVQSAIQRAEYQTAADEADVSIGRIRSVETLFDRAMQAAEVIREEQVRLKEKGVTLAVPSDGVRMAIEQGNYEDASARAEGILASFRTAEEAFDLASQSLATLKCEIIRLKNKEIK